MKALFFSLIATLTVLIAGSSAAQNINIPTPLGGINTGSRPADILTNAAQYGINLGYQALNRKAQKNKSLKQQVKTANQACVYQLDRLEKNDLIVNNMLRIEYKRIQDKFTADGRNKRNPYIVDTHVNDLNRLGRLATYFNSTCQSIQSLQSLYPASRTPLEASYKAFVAQLVVTQPDFSSDEAVAILGGQLGDIQRSLPGLLPGKADKQARPDVARPDAARYKL